MYAFMNDSFSLFLLINILYVDWAKKRWKLATKQGLGSFDENYDENDSPTIYTIPLSFPWLLANVLDPALGDGVPIADCGRTCMLTSSNGIKIGVIGLGEREW